MLSEETAVGDYPVEAVRVMDRIARETEPDLPYGDWVFNRVASDALGRGRLGRPRGRRRPPTRSGSPPLVVPTRSGRTARLVSAHRPRVPVLAVSPRIETVRRLQLLFGVRCALADEWTSLRTLLDDCARLAKETGVARSGRPDRDHRRASRAGAGHEPVRDPPGAVGPVGPGYR